MQNDVPNPSTNLQKYYDCSICLRSFSYKHVLENHIRTHTGEKPFGCKICGKCFARDHHLKTHFRIHTGEKPYKCNYCGKPFRQVGNLRRHHSSHFNHNSGNVGYIYKADSVAFQAKYSFEEKSHMCKICSKCFSFKFELENHLKTHSDEKPYQCNYCGKTFRQAKSVIRHHETFHSKNQDCDSLITQPSESLVSPKCNKISPNNLINNSEETENSSNIKKKKYKCLLCSKSFTRTQNLKYHMNSHTGEKPFKCETCGIRFSYKISLTRHLESHTTSKNIEAKSNQTLSFDTTNGSEEISLNIPDESMALLDQFQDFLQNSELSSMTDDNFDDSINQKSTENVSSSEITNQSQHNCSFCQEVFGSYAREEFHFNGCYLP